MSGRESTPPPDPTRLVGLRGRLLNIAALNGCSKRGSLTAVGILAIFLDRFNASLPTEGSDQGDVHDFPPAARHNKHGDTRGVWMPGHRVGVGDLNLAAVRHANVERLKRPLILGFLEFVDLHVPPPFDSSPQRPDPMCPASRSGSRDRPRKSFVSQQPGISVIRHWRLLDELECLVDQDLAGHSPSEVREM